MSDEIDIEEHDVLDNPNIRRIFPDLSIIKKEIFQYEEEQDTTHENTKDAGYSSSYETQKVHHNVDPAAHIPVLIKSEETTNQTNMNNRLEVHMRFKTFLNSLVDDFYENSDINLNSETNCFNDIKSASSSILSTSTDDKVKNLQKNVFLLGSKPSAIVSNKIFKEKRQPKIVLSNINIYLKSCGQYCEKCLILFPSINVLRNHIRDVHSVKTYAPIKKKKPNVTSPGSKYQCKICTINLSSKGNLQRHIKMVHNMGTLEIPEIETNKVMRSKPSRDNAKNNKTTKPRSEVSENKVKKYHNCFHCDKVFESLEILIEHIYDVLNPNKQNICGNVVSDQNMAENDLTSSKSIQCIICQIHFSTQVALDEHNRKNHISNKMSSDGENYPKVASILKNLLYNPIKDQNGAKALEKEQNEAKTLEKEQNEAKTLEKEQNGHGQTREKNEEENVSSDANDCVFNDDLPANHDNIKNNQDKTEQESKIVKNTSDTIKEHKFYQCYICSQYMETYEPYHSHMTNNHNIKETAVEKAIFDSQCKFCPLKNASIGFYNNHVSKFHHDKWKQVLDLSEEAFESVVFKCIECDLFFLNIQATLNHSEHNEILINWQCSVCQKKLKLKDKPLHIRQHLLTNNITFYTLSKSALNRVLFKCFKCAVHFSEKQYFLHYKTCDLNIPDSAYCNTCDILINRTDMDLHELHHEENESLEFTFIESDILRNRVGERRSTKVNISRFALSFCHFCNCFFVNRAKGKTRVHVEGKCTKYSHMIGKICKICGLVFTPKGLMTHKKLHKKVKNLDLQTYYFYDMNSKMQILPPIAKYPSCKECQVHFLDKLGIRKHICEQQSYKVCNICNIKLTSSALKLHMKYHTYKLSSSALTKRLTTRQSANLNLEQVKVNRAIVSKPSEIVSSENQISNIHNIINKKDIYYIYVCISCHFSVHTYDEVVEHCQNHYYSTKISKLCFDKQKHPKKKCDSYLLLKFNPFYFRFNNDVWIQHIFGNLNKIVIDNILQNSIYKYECRLKMEELQTGPFHLTLYKCDICRLYIDPSKIYNHAMLAECVQCRKYPCVICGLPLSTPTYRLSHEGVHKCLDINIKSYRIILFKKKEHSRFDQVMFSSLNNIILYQCRNCEATVDKFKRDVHKCKKFGFQKCSRCGLLFSNEDYDGHVTLHKELKQFTPENMKVLLFNKPSVSKQENLLRPSFRGTIYDFTFYKCTTCNLCLKRENDIGGHMCVPDYEKAQCIYCNLYFLKKDLQGHHTLHENNLEFEENDFRSNVVAFSVPPDTLTVKRANTLDKKRDYSVNKKTKVNLNTTQTIYKCTCGLHFLEQADAEKHANNCNPRMKISRQSCVKCELLFTPGELFSHLLKHHGDKNVPFKYDIVIVNNVKEKQK